MPFSIAGKVEQDVLGPLAAGLRPDIERVLRLAAFNVERKAKEVVPVDTSATKNSITVIHSGLEARIGASTEYAPALEFGGGRRAATPFLIPSLESEAPLFVQAVGELLRG